MDAIYERCCGLDIHKRTVVARLIVPGPGRQSRKEIRTFGTMTDDLLALADWLATESVTHVAMESTGVYWKAPFNYWRSSSRSCWPTPNISRLYQAARPT